MTDDTSYEIRDETHEQIQYCPRCGSPLDKSDIPVRCPEHGIVNIDYWESEE